MRSMKPTRNLKIKYQAVADSEGEFGSDDLNSEVDIDMNGSRLKIKALEERIGSEPRAPWFNYACLTDTKSKPGQQQKSLDKAIKSDYFQDTGEYSNHSN